MSSTCSRSSSLSAARSSNHSLTRSIHVSTVSSSLLSLNLSLCVSMPNIDDACVSGADVLFTANNGVDVDVDNNAGVDDDTGNDTDNTTVIVVDCCYMVRQFFFKFVVRMRIYNQLLKTITILLSLDWIFGK
ncbi:hypothetical protein BDB00DRAFT_786537 [Zychaea mexicana]|uniref:uncharacterized protein n=1 Tax=Zychaea mexicana TaxID=64656 RepID=UPI0022FDE654|nr:uncharacterized protein BDB00DRAFT_786537 [Zychaea mexicana]KAI9495193.1 hypothetical protein BDB00DRAFT_786537 [Zychaea mexicana]